MLEQHFEWQTMLHRWDFGLTRTSKNEKCSHPDRQLDDTDSCFRHPFHEFTYEVICAQIYYMVCNENITKRQELSTYIHGNVVFICSIHLSNKIRVIIVCRLNGLEF